MRGKQVLNIHIILPSHVVVNVVTNRQENPWGGARAYGGCKKGRRNECVTAMFVCVCVCVWLADSLCPTFLPSIESTPLCFDSAAGLLGEGAEGQPSSLCSAWVVWVCVLLSSDPDSLRREKKKE